MGAVTAIYPPPVPGLPYLAVVILTSGEVDVTPFQTEADANAYLEVCDAGMLADAKRKRISLDA